MPEPEFVRATSVEGAIAALGRAPSDSIVVAGGTVVGSLINQRLVAPAILVDISRIGSLRKIEITGDGGLRIGSLVTHQEMLCSPAIASAAPLLKEIAAEMSCPRLRNRGTVGGSLCTIGGQGDPATGLIALGARLHLRGPNGARIVALEDFYKDAFAVDLGDGELVEFVSVPPARSGAGFAFHKLGPRKAMDWTQITASVVLTADGKGAITEIRIGMNGVGETPSRARKTEAALRGWSAAGDWVTAAAALNEEIEPPGDLVYSARFKRQLAAVALKRSVEHALARAAEKRAL
jgi:carbon-monoxide dehydrogenase medium subunit